MGDASRNHPGGRRGVGGTTDVARDGPAASQTVTIDRAQEAEPDLAENREQGARQNAPPLTLRLVRRRRVQWTKETHDNENDGKKSSKSCCIFHKQREFGESSSESDEDKSDHSDKESDSEGESSAGSSSSGGQRRASNSSHVKEKLREMEREQMRRELGEAPVDDA